MLRLASMLLCGTSALVGCGGGAAPAPDGDDERGRQSAVTSCRGLFQGLDVASEDRKRLAKQVVPVEVKSARTVARELVADVDSYSSTPALCALEDAERPSTVFNFDVRWSGGDGEAGPSVVYQDDPGEEAGSRTPAALVHCRIESGGSEGAQEDAGELTFELWDRLGLSGALHRELLLGAAEDVTTRMGCANERDFRDPYVQADDDEPSAGERGGATSSTDDSPVLR
jgi:hypothetical protein